MGFAIYTQKLHKYEQRNYSRKSQLAYAVFPHKLTIYGQSDPISGLNRSGLVWDYHYHVSSRLCLQTTLNTSSQVTADHRRPPQVTGGDRQWTYD